MYPKYYSYFPFKNVPMEELAQDKRLHRHAVTVIASLSSLIDSLDDPSILLTLLESIGERHGRRNIPPEAFDVSK